LLNSLAIQLTINFLTINLHKKGAQQHLFLLF
jgi:hypothetical protein